jgi:hypothetical protein
MSDTLGPEFIQVAIDGLLGLLKEHTADLLAEMDTPRVPITHFGYAFRGQAMNAPELWVEPVSTVFDDEGTATHGISQLRITLGIVAGDPEACTLAALDYVRAASLAISQNEFAELGDAIQRVFVREHNYGALRAGGKGFAVFPEIYVLVEMEEV